MRPRTQSRYTITGKAGVYVCPSLAATDARIRTLLRLLPSFTRESAPRIWHDVDLLLDHRLELMRERGSWS